jgi:ABC-type lipoprotein release transport system permease subunit
MLTFITMAFRNLGRNRRRTFFSALALTLSVTLLMFINGFFNGETRTSLEATLQLDSGHIQIRDADYDPDKFSVAWDYLIENPEQVAAQVETLEQVQVATPRLIASGIVSVKDDTTGVQVVGIDPDSSANDPYREGLVSGEFLTADDREGILIGLPIAENMGLKIGDQLNLLINTSDGTVDEQLFTVRGIFTTGSTNYDKGLVFLPLAKAQAFSGAGDHASLIFVLLHNRDDADAVAAALQNPNYQVKTWRELNDMLVLIEDFSNIIISTLNLIVLGVTVTVIVNTLLMSVFERTREVGILTAIGMKGRQIMGLFVLEAGVLAAAGISVGLLLGWGVVAYFGRVGIYFGDLGVNGMLLGDRIYSFITLPDVINLTVL